MRRGDQIYAWPQPHPVVSDTVLAAGLFALLAVPSAFGYDPGWPHLALGAVMFGALVFRRVRPVESFAVVALAGFVQWIAGAPCGPLAGGHPRGGVPRCRRHLSWRA